MREGRGESVQARAKERGEGARENGMGMGVQGKGVRMHREGAIQ